MFYFTIKEGDSFMDSFYHLLFFKKKESELNLDLSETFEDHMHLWVYKTYHCTQDVETLVVNLYIFFSFFSWVSTMQS